MPSSLAERAGSSPPAPLLLDPAAARGAGAELLRRRRTLGRIREATVRLRARTTVEDVLTCVPDEVRAACGLGRVAVYTRRGSDLIPWAGDLPARAAGDRMAPVAVAPGSPESEILRRGTSIQTTPGEGERDGRLLEHPRGYVAVAVQVEGRTLAVIAAAGGPRHRPDLADADALLDVAERLGWTLERLRLAERAAAQREQLRAALDAAQRALDDPAPAHAELASADRPAVARPGPGPAERGWGLTPREHEVLRHVAEGKTNRLVGEHLFLSEGTVKCHVKRILRKLGAANRAEAVARYLGSPGADACTLPVRPAAAPVPSIAPLRLLTHEHPVRSGR